MVDSVEVKLTLPSDLVRDAREFNLLTDEVIIQLLQEAVDRCANVIINQEIHDFRHKKHLASNDVP